jgi:hypothetical protein
MAASVALKGFKPFDRLVFALFIVDLFVAAVSFEDGRLV